MVLGKPQTDPTLEWFLSHCHIHKYPSKSTLIHQGEKAETLYYIVKGSVAVLIKDEEGKEMILSYLNQGDFIGELGLFEEGQERSAWVRAKTACEVAEISYKKFRQLIQVNPDILMRLSSQMARRLQVTSEKVGNLAFLDVVMPGTDGYELCRKIKHNSYTRLMPVLMLTSRSSPFDRARGALSGCDSYLTKPITWDTFSQSVDKALMKSFRNDRAQMIARGYRT